MVTNITELFGGVTMVKKLGKEMAATLLAVLCSASAAAGQPAFEGQGLSLRASEPGLVPIHRGASLKPIGSDFALQRNRTLLAAHWQPLSLGAWKLGTSLGYLKGLGGARPGAMAVMPMATLAQPGYCVNLGLLPARGEREPSLFMGVHLPLQ